MSIWGSYENLAYEIFYWLAYTKICTNENYLLYGNTEISRDGQGVTVYTRQISGQLLSQLQSHTAKN